MPRDTLIVPVQAIEGGHRRSLTDFLAVEEPLEIRVNGSTISITMRTPGDDFDLAAGFLFTEGIIEHHGELLLIHQPKTNVSEVRLAPGVEIDLDRHTRHFYAASSCGICGKTSIEAVNSKPRRQMSKEGPVFTAELIHRFPDTLRQSQRLFQNTGGLHAAALFSASGELLAVREDIGRHNAVDKVIGWGIAEGESPFSESLMLVSGRAGFELIQKAAMAGIPILAAVGAPSSLAVEAALRFGMTLLGFVRGSRFNTYSHAWRIR